MNIIFLYRYSIYLRCNNLITKHQLLF